MAKILANGQWYEEVSSAAFYESDFERLVLRHAEKFFPNYIAVPFKKLVTDGAEAAKADLALIHVEYRDWWVVEVELAHHSLVGHVEPQVKTLAGAHYGPDEARHLCERSGVLDEGRLCSMLKGAQPRVIVIVNRPCPAWRPVLALYEAIVMVLEIFRSDLNEFIYRLNGEAPAQIVEAVSRCYLDKQLPRLLTLESPGILTIGPGERLSISYQNGSSDWVRLDGADKVWLQPLGKHPLQIKQEYVLSRSENGAFTLRELG